MNKHEVVSREEWLTARKEHLAKEKEFTQLRDQLSQQRRDLPWVKVEKEYLFEGPDGEQTLPDLFDGCGQLIIYHFMYGPDWKEGCPVVHSGPTISMALTYISSIGTSILLPCLRRVWKRCKHIRSAWAGVSTGCHHLAVISTMTIRSRSRPTKWNKARCSTTSASQSFPARRRLASVYFTRTRKVRCSTTIRVMREDWIC